MLLVFDCETYIYKASTACKVLKQCETDRFIWGEYYDIRKGLDYFNKVVEDIKANNLCDDIILVVGDVNNWRKEKYPTYKANRKDKEKPLMYELLLNELYNKYEVVSLPNLEADDTCRIIYEDNKNYPTRKVLVSMDKDFKSFPCELYDPLHNTKCTINKAQADYNLMKQIIMGDTADGYSGLKDYGEAKTIKFLDDEPRTFEDVKELFKEKGQLKEYLPTLNQATIVSIDRYNFDTGYVKEIR